jgi:hypothetical protein
MSPELLAQAVTTWPFRRVRRRTQHHPLGPIHRLNVTWRYRFDEDGNPLHTPVAVP